MSYSGEPALYKHADARGAVRAELINAERRPGFASSFAGRGLRGVLPPRGLLTQTAEAPAPRAACELPACLRAPEA
ncbi:hypothetical protein CGL52_09730 [Pyrobaculum aerophilum]|uniref:Uncharacterized protein n=1 Tax=Pyrobaculum aerophilum TaxID=13773 RepID=A0A371R1D7_9CREN|nr:hypothetical protein CGL52_09730 [Pyrobaculum aerophilum]